MVGFLKYLDNDWKWVISSKKSYIKVPCSSNETDIYHAFISINLEPSFPDTVPILRNAMFPT